jgi:UDP-N-acetylglucosamine acyltransferase
VGDGLHPTAVVDPRAEIGAGVTVGPYSVVGGEVRLDAGVEVGNHVTLEGRMVVGPGARIGHGSVLGGPPQDLKYRPGTPSGLRIGAGTVIREHVTIHRATTADGWTEIGEDCLLMSSAHVAHDCRVGEGAIIINYAGITGHCEIGEHATIGGYTGVIPFIRVGAYAYVGGCSKITKDVPPYMLADGAPALVHGVNVVGMRRAGVTPADRRLLQDAHRILYRSGLSPRAAADRIRVELPAAPVLVGLLAFIDGSRRGICGAAREERGTGGEASALDPEQVL